MLVQITGAVVEVERGAGLVVSELFEENILFVVWGQYAGAAIAGKPRIEAGEGSGGALFYPCRARRISLCKQREPFAQPCAILMRNGEDADAALRAAGPADEVRTAALISIGD